MKVVSRDAWLSARRELLAKEKEWSLRQDALSERRLVLMATVWKLSAITRRRLKSRQVVEAVRARLSGLGA